MRRPRSTFPAPANAAPSGLPVGDGPGGGTGSAPQRLVAEEGWEGVGPVPPATTITLLGARGDHQRRPVLQLASGRAMIPSQYRARGRVSASGSAGPSGAMGSPLHNVAHLATRCGGWPLFSSPAATPATRPYDAASTSRCDGAGEKWGCRTRTPVDGSPTSLSPRSASGHTAASPPPRRPRNQCWRLPGRRRARPGRLPRCRLLPLPH